MQPIVFLDFEASALFGASWPVEAGYASSCGRQDAFLLARHRDWSLEDWCSRAAQIHGISLDDLAESGVGPQVALDRLEVICAGAVVVSDAPAFDNFWLNRLAQAAGREAKFVIVDWTDVLPSDLSVADRDAILKEARAGEGARHRAMADARALRSAWSMSWQRAHAAWADA